MLAGQRRVIEVASRNRLPVFVDTAIDHQHFVRRMLRQPYRFIDQWFVMDGSAGAHSRISGNQQLRFCIIDACRAACCGKTTEHHRMHCTQSRAGEHREYRFGNHRHVKQHAVATAYTLRSDHCGHHVDRSVQLAVGVGFFAVGFGGNINQRGLVAARRQVAIQRVMTEVGQPADKPPRKRWPAVIEHLVETPLPVDAPRLFGPE